MIIDGHAHACGDLLSTNGILRVLDASNADRVVLVPGEHESTKTYRLPSLARWIPSQEVASLTNAMTRLVVRMKGLTDNLEADNEKVFRLRCEHPDRIIQFYWTLLRDGFDADRVGTHLREWAFQGLKLHQCWDRFSIPGKAFQAAARFATENGLPIFIHLGGAGQATALARFAAEHPETTFVVGHLYQSGRFIRFGKPVPNVYFDLSCPDLISHKRLGRTLSHFGADRLMLGSDSPYGLDNLARNIRRIRTLDIPESEKDLILGGNMARLLGLSARGDLS